MNINSIDICQCILKGFADTFSPMSEEIVDAFLRGADAISRGDLLDIPETVHPEAVFEPLRAATEGAFIGHEGMRRFIIDTEEMFEVFRISYTEVRDLGDRVLAIGSIRMRARESGVEADVPTASVAEYRDGLLWRYKDYGNVRSALRALELGE
jgi:ketosteroid isomerase-like protein